MPFSCIKLKKERSLRERGRTTDIQRAREKMSEQERKLERKEERESERERERERERD